MPGQTPKGTRYGGRAKGTPNKTTRTVRETFERVFNELQEGKVADLATWGKQNPTEFYKIAAKLIPHEVGLQGSLVVNVVTGVPDAGEDLV